MALVEPSIIARLKELRERARGSSSYETSYQWAARGLEAAIATLEQVNTQTADYKFVLEKK
ncbi:UNVERIFIED_CONTAM: hypothetical protein RF648_20080 [Kocuria sp. CPCC 205274]